VYGGQLGMNKLLDKQWLAENGFWKRCVSSLFIPLISVNDSTSRSFLHMNIAGFVARTKYYSVWCIAYASFLFSHHSKQR
jgi:hypothetical protein